MVKPSTPSRCVSRLSNNQAKYKSDTMTGQSPPYFTKLIVYFVVLSCGAPDTNGLIFSYYHVPGPGALIMKLELWCSVSVHRKIILRHIVIFHSSTTRFYLYFKQTVLSFLSLF